MFDITILLVYQRMTHKGKFVRRAGDLGTRIKDKAATQMNKNTFSRLAPKAIHS
jgi:hypothetical protein